MVSFFELITQNSRIFFYESYREFSPITAVNRLCDSVWINIYMLFLHQNIRVQMKIDVLIG